MKAIVSVLGSDKPGIIAKISAILYEAGANILDLSQTVLREELFAMTMLVDFPGNASFERLKEQLEAAGRELNLDVRLQREEIFKSMHRI